MNTDRFSLMTFTLDLDVAMKKLSVKDCLLMAKYEGIPHVDVMDPSEERRQEYMKAAKETGVTPLCYIGSISFFSETEEKIHSVMAHHIHAAKELGASLYMIVPMNVRKDEKICNKLGRDQVRTHLKKYFTMAVEMAQDTGVKVCFETTPRDYTGLSSTADCKWILEQVPGLGLVYDTANMLPAGDDPLEYYETLKTYMIHTHVKDVSLSKRTWKDRLFCSEHTKTGETMKCCLFGEGVVPLEEILCRMQKDGYKGTFALEYAHPAKYPSDLETNRCRLEEHTAFLRKQ